MFNRQYSTFYKRKLKYIFFIIMLIPSAHSFLIDTKKDISNWQILQPGIDYLKITSAKSPWSKIHIYRLSLKKYQLNIANSKNPKQNLYNLSRQYPNFVLAINGGFFDEKYSSLGLRISNSKIISPFRSISWWGVLAQKNNKVYIASNKEFRMSKHITFAIQCGPRLIIKGKIPDLKPGKAERTALGIDANNRLLVIVTEHFPLSTKRLAQILKKQPISCVDALNLDGGHSTQMIANIPPNNSHTVFGISPIADSVVINKILN